MTSTNSSLALRVLVLLGLLIFGAFLATQYGLVDLAISSDRSYLSAVILLLYGVLTVHWLWVAFRLSAEINAANAMQDGTAIAPSGLTGGLHDGLAEGPGPEQVDAMLTLFGDQLANRHALGHFASDVLLRLGLLGTIIGFILMLLPVADITEFDSSVMQRLLSSMSGGMAVALYTTLAGLITSTLLRLQYHVLDSAAVNLTNRVSMLVRANLRRPQEKAQDAS